MKIVDIVEAAGVGRITKQNQTPDVGPNEVAKQAAKFGNKVDKDGYPPLLHSKAAKNSTPNKLFNLGLAESQINEVATLTPAEIYNRPGRAERVLQKIKTGSPFTLQDGTPFIVDPKSYAAVKKFLDAKSAGRLVLPEKGTARKASLGNFLKTAEFGGQQKAFDQAEVAGKEAYKIKPKDIFKDEVFSGTSIANEIISNPELQQSEIGKHIIQAAQEIMAGRNPDLSKIPPQYLDAIRDYAGEYLGVLAMFKGLANFPGMEGFFKHLGVKNLKGLKLYFPKASNNPLGDSIGSFTNPMTNHQIIISSKGGAQGAPPSLDNLKIPDELAADKSMEAEVAFIQAAQKAKAIRQPYELANILYQYAPDKLPASLRKMLPFSNTAIERFVGLSNPKEYRKGDVVLFTKQQAAFVNEVVNLKRVRDNSTPGGIMHYALNRVIMDAVNNKKALPNFEPLAREILQKNFIQIFTRIAQNKMVWSIVWPNRQMGTGNITLYHKASSIEPAKQKISFSVHD